jgi:hypothetical protein
VKASPALDASALKAELLACGEPVCLHLLSAGKRVGCEWRCGNLRGEQGKSLSINLHTGVWEDFATGQKGSNLLELWIQVTGKSFPDALREAAEFCGHRIAEPARKDDDAARKRARWPAYAMGSRRELLSVSRLRGIALEGIELASERGLLRFAEWREQACWIVTDGSRVNAQARRLDGKPFVVEGTSRKAITLPGSRACVPLGLLEAREFPAVAIVEGGPDLLAAHGCIWAEDRSDVAIVAMMGASHRPGPEIWAKLAGKKVRIYCHADDAGMTAARAWGEAIFRAGAAKIDGFRFDGLRKTDGSPVEDLNDLAALHSDDFEARRDIWEILP